MPGLEEVFVQEGLLVEELDLELEPMSSELESDCLSAVESDSSS